MPALPAFAERLSPPGPAERHHHGAAQRRRMSFGYAPGRNRTCDLALRRRTLYPLSYRRGTISVAPMEVSARTATLELAETFVISRESSGTAEGVLGGVRQRT